MCDFRALKIFVFLSLAALGLNGCSGGGGQGFAPIAAGDLPRETGELTSLISGQLASVEAAELVGFIMETDSLLLTSIQGADSLEGFLVKNPIERFEYPLNQQTDFVKLAWLESDDGINFFTPEPNQPSHGKYFLWGHLSPPDRLAQFTEQNLNFALSAELHCANCVEPKTFLNGNMQVEIAQQSGQLTLLSENAATQIQTAITINNQAMIDAADTLLTFHYAGEELPVESWQIIGALFGENLSEAGGGLAISTETQNFTGAFLGSRTDGP